MPRRQHAQIATSQITHHQGKVLIRPQLFLRLFQTSVKGNGSKAKQVPYAPPPPPPPRCTAHDCVGRRKHSVARRSQALPAESSASALHRLHRATQASRGRIQETSSRAGEGERKEGTRYLLYRVPRNSAARGSTDSFGATGRIVEDFSGPSPLAMTKRRAFGVVDLRTSHQFCLGSSMPRTECF